jgi:hypothetical protein
MMFGNSLTLQFILQHATAIAAAIGLLLNAFQARQRAKQRRIEIATEARDRIHRDLGMRAAFSIIDFNDLTFPENFHDTVNERRVDRLLTHLDSLAVKYQAGLLTSREMRLIEYEYATVYRNHSVRRYFSYLDDLKYERNLAKRPFEAFDSVGRKLYGPV